MENSPLLSSFVSVKGIFPPFQWHDAVMRGVHIFECMTKKNSANFKYSFHFLYK